MAATKIDLLDAANRHEFREDLYFRLGVAELHIPPLTQRREDIPLLYTHFLREFAGQYQREVPEVPREHIERLVSRTWRGNVRELRNAAERHVLGIGGGAQHPTVKRLVASRLPEQMDDVEANLHSLGTDGKQRQHTGGGRRTWHPAPHAQRKNAPLQSRAQGFR